MAYSIFGHVVAVRKFANGDVEVDFQHEKEIITYRHSSDSGRLGNFPKELIEILVTTLSTYICVDIFFGDDGNPTHVELMECEDEEDESDDDDDEEEDESDDDDDDEEEEDESDDDSDLEK